MDFQKLVEDPIYLYDDVNDNQLEDNYAINQTQNNEQTMAKPVKNEPLNTEEIEEAMDAEIQVRMTQNITDKESLYNTSSLHNIQGSPEVIDGDNEIEISNHESEILENHDEVLLDRSAYRSPSDPYGSPERKPILEVQERFTHSPISHVIKSPSFIKPEGTGEFVSNPLDEELVLLPFEDIEDLDFLLKNHYELGKKFNYEYIIDLLDRFNAMNNEDDWNQIYQSENVTVHTSLKGSHINFKHPFVKSEMKVAKVCKFILR